MKSLGLWALLAPALLSSPGYAQGDVQLQTSWIGPDGDVGLAQIAARGSSDPNDADADGRVFLTQGHTRGHYRMSNANREFSEEPTAFLGSTDPLPYPYASRAIEISADETKLYTASGPRLYHDYHDGNEFLSSGTYWEIPNPAVNEIIKDIALCDDGDDPNDKGIVVLTDFRLFLLEYIPHPVNYAGGTFQLAGGISETADNSLDATPGHVGMRAVEVHRQDLSGTTGEYRAYVTSSLGQNARFNRVLQVATVKKNVSGQEVLGMSWFGEGTGVNEDAWWNPMADNLQECQDLVNPVHPHGSFFDIDIVTVRLPENPNRPRIFCVAAGGYSDVGDDMGCRTQYQDEARAILILDVTRGLPALFTVYDTFRPAGLPDTEHVRGVYVDQDLGLIYAWTSRYALTIANWMFDDLINVVGEVPGPGGPDPTGLTAIPFDPTFNFPPKSGVARTDDLNLAFGWEGPDRIAYNASYPFRKIRFSESAAPVVLQETYVPQDCDGIMAIPGGSTDPDNSVILAPMFQGGLVAYEVVSSVGSNPLEFRVSPDSWSGKTQGACEAFDFSPDIGGKPYAFGVDGHSRLTRFRFGDSAIPGIPDYTKPGYVIAIDDAHSPNNPYSNLNLSVAWAKADLQQGNGLRYVELSDPGPGNAKWLVWDACNRNNGIVGLMAARVDQWPTDANIPDTAWRLGGIQPTTAGSKYFTSGQCVDAVAFGTDAFAVVGYTDLVTADYGGFAIFDLSGLDVAGPLGFADDHVEHLKAPSAGYKKVSGVAFNSDLTRLYVIYSGALTPPSSGVGGAVIVYEFDASASSGSRLGDPVATMEVSGTTNDFLNANNVQPWQKMSETCRVYDHGRGGQVERLYVGFNDGNLLEFENTLGSNTDALVLIGVWNDKFDWAPDLDKGKQDRILDQRLVDFGNGPRVLMSSMNQTVTIAVPSVP